MLMVVILIILIIIMTDGNDDNKLGKRQERKKGNSNRPLTEARVQFLTGMSQDIKKRSLGEVQKANCHLCFTNNVGETVTSRYVTPQRAKSAESCGE